MEIVIISDEQLKEELLAQSTAEMPLIEWLQEPATVSGADCYIDLLFDYSPERINFLKELKADLIIINAVNMKSALLPNNIVRIAGWPTFLNRSVIEANTTNKDLQKKVDNIFSKFNKTIEWTPDIEGFISPRIISMLINEAYYTLDDKVSGKDEIDTAMKLGTRYPFGPFEWSKKIGLKNVLHLLTILSTNQKRYTPSSLIKQEVENL